jgi:hypothetical protein
LIGFVPVVIFKSFFDRSDHEDESERGCIGSGTRWPNFFKKGDNADDQIKEVGKTLKLRNKVRRLRI